MMRSSSAAVSLRVAAVGRVASLTHAQLLRAGKQVGKLVERGLFGVDTDPNGGGVAAVLGDSTKTAVGSHDPGGGDGIFGGTGESFARGHLLLRVGQIRQAGLQVSEHLRLTHVVGDSHL